MKSADLFRQHGAAWRRAALLVLLAVALALLALSDPVHAALLDVLAVVDAIIVRHPVWGAVVFVIYAALSAMLAFMSVALLLPVAVYAWGEPVSILLLWGGWTLGGALAYVVGRFLGRGVVHWLTADVWLSRIEKRVGPQTPFSLVLLFQLALPSEIPGYVLGMVRYSFFRYLLVLAAVELLFTAALVHLGASFVERRIGMVLAIGGAMALFSLLAFQLLRRRMSRAAQDRRSTHRH